MSKKRAVVSIVLLIALGTTAFLGQRVATLGTELDDARAEASSRRAAAAGSAERLAKTASELDDANRELDGLRKEVRGLRARVKRSQRCGGQYRGHVWLFPTSGPPGTRVEFAGDCLAAWGVDSRRELVGGYGIFLIRQLGDLHPSGECEHIVGTTPYDVELKGGRIEGFFTVGHDGYCFQHSEGAYPVVPGTYRVGMGCHACGTNAKFRVTR